MRKENARREASSFHREERSTVSMWFSVSLLTKGDLPDQPEIDILWEESIVLIEAESEDQARVVAERIAKNAETQYRTASGEHISWKFHTIERIYKIEDDVLQTGTELFSRFLRWSEVKSLLTPFSDTLGEAM
jgi:hypothetical protein